MNNEKAIEELLTRGVSEVVDAPHLTKRLKEGKPLRIKLGIDPTSPNIHIGRAVPLLKLRDFQELGHKIILIVGDFTGIIGDTSDKDAERKMLTEEEIKINMASYIEQAGKILDIEKVEIHHNSEWLAKLDYKEIGFQANQFGLADFIARDNIKTRLDAGKRVSLREVLYPLMQGYDSVMVKADVELGATDQRFNLLSGRTMQERYNQPPQDILITNLIMGTDGRKMSSSWGNTINLTDSAEDMFGKIMSIPDNMILIYFEHCTRVDMKEVEEFKKKLGENTTNPRDIKMILASEVVKLYWGEQKAESAKEEFVTIFQKREIPTEIPEKKVSSLNIIDALVETELANTRSEARRLIEQKGIKVNDTTIEDENFQLKPADLISKGKRFFVKII